MPDYNITVTPTVVGPDDRLVLLVNAPLDAQGLRAVVAETVRVFGEGRCLVIAGDSVEAVVVRAALLDEGLAALVEGPTEGPTSGGTS